MASKRELKLPVIKGNAPPAKYLCMDDYLKFVIINLKFVMEHGKHDEGQEKPPVASVSFVV